MDRNLPDDWDTYWRRCEDCGVMYHESGCEECACDFEENREDEE